MRSHLHQESKCRTIRESGAPPTVKQARCGAICSISPHKMGSSAAPAVDHIATKPEACQPGAKVTLARRGCGRTNGLHQHRAGIQMIEALRQLSNQLCQSPRAARPPPPATPCTPPSSQTSWLADPDALAGKSRHMHDKVVPTRQLVHCGMGWVADMAPGLVNHRHDGTAGRHWTHRSLPHRCGADPHAVGYGRTCRRGDLRGRDACPPQGARHCPTWSRPACGRQCPLAVASAP